MCEIAEKARQPRNPPGGRGEIVTAKRRIADALDAVIAIQREAWRDPKSEAQWRASLRDYALPKPAGSALTPSKRTTC